MAPSASYVGSSTGASLQAFSIELFESICKHLVVEDRVSLVSCCAALWFRPDLSCSTALWGTLVLQPRQLAPLARYNSILAWLSRHRPALRSLAANGGTCGPTPLKLLCDLGACGPLPITALHLPYCCTHQGLWEAFAPVLATCTAITQLDLCGNALTSLPPQLSCLSNLAHLELGGNELDGEDALGPLHVLTALTFLGISSCAVMQLPPHLSALTRLQELDASGDYEDLEGPFQLEPLLPLPSLTRLNLCEVRMHCLPPQVSRLTGLLSLELASVLPPFDLNDGGVLRPLCHLTALTRLDVSECGLTSLPPELSSLGALLDLNLRSNFALGAAGLAALGPLGQLTALTRLVLGGFKLQALPPVLASLSALAHLDLSGCESLGEGGDATLWPLSHLLALTRLDLGGCALESLPSSLSALTNLQSLELKDNDLSGEAAGGGSVFGVLPRLPTLTRLDLSWCHLAALPPEAAALSALAQLELAGNQLGLSLEETSPDAPAGLQPLTALTALTRLGLAACYLDRIPPQFCALGGLQDLDLSSNFTLGGAEAQSRGDGGEERGCGEAGGAVQRWLPLASLSALTRLDLRRCALQALPGGEVVSPLVDLQELDLGYNSLGAAGALEGLRQLGLGCAAEVADGGGAGSQGGSLQQLSLHQCGLKAMPEQLSVLRALRRLRLSGNRALRGGTGLRQLRGLPRLACLEVDGCELLLGREPQLRALKEQGVMVCF